MTQDRITRFSQCRRWRYTLWRDWTDEVLELEEREGNRTAQYAMFIGLNPSTADETNDDPTVRRCIRFAKDWGYGALCMTNAFAFRATDPNVMKSFPEPIGEENDDWLVRCAEDAGIVIAAWGNHGTHLGRFKTVQHLIPRLMCLGMTGTGQPRHPLYLRADSKPVSYVIQC